LPNEIYHKTLPVLRKAGRFKPRCAVTAYKTDEDAFTPEMRFNAYTGWISWLNPSLAMPGPRPKTT